MNTRYKEQIFFVFRRAVVCCMSINSLARPLHTPCTPCPQTSLTEPISLARFVVRFFVLNWLFFLGFFIIYAYIANDI